MRSAAIRQSTYSAASAHRLSSSRASQINVAPRIWKHVRKKREPLADKAGTSDVLLPTSNSRPFLTFGLETQCLLTGQAVIAYQHGQVVILGDCPLLHRRHDSVGGLGVRQASAFPQQRLETILSKLLFSSVGGFDDAVSIKQQT